MCSHHPRPGKQNRPNSQTPKGDAKPEQKRPKSSLIFGTAMSLEAARKGSNAVDDRQEVLPSFLRRAPALKEAKNPSSAPTNRQEAMSAYSRTKAALQATKKEAYGGHRHDKEDTSVSDPQEDFLDVPRESPNLPSKNRLPPGKPFYVRKSWPNLTTEGKGETSSHDGKGTSLSPPITQTSKKRKRSPSTRNMEIGGGRSPEPSGSPPVGKIQTGGIGVSAPSRRNNVEKSRKYGHLAESEDDSPPISPKKAAPKGKPLTRVPKTTTIKRPSLSPSPLPRDVGRKSTGQTTRKSIGDKPAVTNFIELHASSNIPRVLYAVLKINDKDTKDVVLDPKIKIHDDLEEWVRKCNNRQQRTRDLREDDVLHAYMKPFHYLYDDRRRAEKICLEENENLEYRCFGVFVVAGRKLAQEGGKFVTIEYEGRSRGRFEGCYYVWEMIPARFIVDSEVFDGMMGEGSDGQFPRPKTTTLKPQQGSMNVTIQASTGGPSIVTYTASQFAPNSKSNTNIQDDGRDDVDTEMADADGNEKTDESRMPRSIIRRWPENSTRSGTEQYLVDWKPSWEPASNFDEDQEFLGLYWDDLEEKAEVEKRKRRVKARRTG